MDAVKTGKFIQKKRTDLKMTQQGLADIINVSATAVSKWENGHSLPDISMLEPLADALDTTVSEIILGEIDPKSPETAETSSISHNEIAVKSIIDESINQRRKSVLNTIKAVSATLAAVLFLVLSIKLANNNYDIVLECCLVFACLVSMAVCAVVQIISQDGKSERRYAVMAASTITILLSIGLCICLGIRLSMAGSTSGPYDGIDLGTSREAIINHKGSKPDAEFSPGVYYADSVMLYTDQIYLGMEGRITYWLKDDILVMSVFYPDDFCYTRDIELKYLRQFQEDFGTAELSTNGFGLDASTVRFAYVIRSPINTKSGVSESMILLLRYYRRDAFFILGGYDIPNLPLVIEDIRGAFL